jgi:cyanophycinase
LIRKKGYVMLAGGAEFGGRMRETDSRAIGLAGGEDARVEIIPAAAKPDENHHRAGERGVKWFRGLGASGCVLRMLIDRSSANHPEIVAGLQAADFIYLLGGFPGYLADSLSRTASWEAMLGVHREGGVLAGSSAGAMVLAEYFYDPFTDEVRKGLGLLQGLCILPHYQSSSINWLARLRDELPDILLLGLDEETAVLDDVEGGWGVYGRGDAWLIDSSIRRFRPGECIPFGDLPSP